MASAARPTTRGPVLAAGLGLLLAACTSTPDRPAVDPRFAAAVRDHYNANAAEDLAGCDRPQLVLLRELVTVSSTPEMGVLRMRAVFDFEQRDPQTLQLICSGQGRRFFTVAPARTGAPTVQGMSGRRRAAA